MSRARRLRPLVAASALFASARASAVEDTLDLQDLLNETVVVGASRSAEKGSTAPAVTTTLTSDDIRRFGIRTIDEAIDFLSLGAATSNTLRAVEVGSRGVLLPGDQGNHFLLLVNGHAMNEALFGAARFGRGAGIPLEMVDRIEVILGPGSVLYGSSAMLGVINVVTKAARDFQGTHVVAESEILKSLRAGAGGGYEFELFGAPASAVVQLEYYRQDGPTFTLGPQMEGLNSYDARPWEFRPGQHTGIWGGPARHSHYAEVPSGLLTFRAKNFELHLRASMYKRAAPFNHDFILPDSNFDDPNNYERDRSAYIDARYKIPLSAVVQLQTRAYGDAFDYNRYANVSAKGPPCPFSVATCRHVASGASRWAGTEISASFDWLKDGSAVTLIGFDGRARFVASQFDVFEESTGRPLASSDSVLRVYDRVFGAYAQQTWSPTTWLALNGGARLDYDQRFDQRVSPRVAASAQTWRGGTLKAIYSEAFRAPSWQEFASARESQVPADNLRPETVRSVEGAIDQKLGSHRLLFGVFRSWWNDLVELHVLSVAEIREAQRAGTLPLFPSTAPTQYRNVATIDNYGFNAGYEGTLAQTRLRYGVNVTGAIARRNDPALGSSPLTVAPQVFGNARVAYSFGDEYPTVALAGHFLGRRASDRVAHFSPPPYAPPLVELRATLSGSIPGIKGLSYRATANYAFAARGPYVIGPVQQGVDTQARDTNTGEIIVRVRPPELIPIDRFRAGVGLQYDF